MAVLPPIFETWEISHLNLESEKYLSHPQDSTFQVQLKYYPKQSTILGESAEIEFRIYSCNEVNFEITYKIAIGDKYKIFQGKISIFMKIRFLQYFTSLIKRRQFKENRSLLCKLLIC